MSARRSSWVPLALSAAAVLTLAPLAPAQKNQAVASPRELDVRKRVAEGPTKQLIAAQTAPAASAGFTNPRVQPGRVQWHASFAAACQAARKSGKPVLLFQMLGKLDDQFC